MYNCVNLASFFVLINGFSKGFFRDSRGLRQGDPLSPYLFIMVVEGLGRMIRKAKDGFLSAFAVGNMMISHL